MANAECHDSCLIVRHSGKLVVGSDKEEKKKSLEQELLLDGEPTVHYVMSKEIGHNWHDLD